MFFVPLIFCITAQISLAVVYTYIYILMYLFLFSFLIKIILFHFDTPIQSHNYLINQSLVVL